MTLLIKGRVLPQVSNNCIIVSFLQYNILEPCAADTKHVISDFFGLSYWFVLSNFSTSFSSGQNFANIGKLCIKDIVIDGAGQMVMVVKMVMVIMLLVVIRIAVM